MIRFTQGFIILFFATILTSCMKDDQNSSLTLGKSNISVPVVTTNIISNLTPAGVTCGGTVVSDGGASVTSFGVCWSIDEYPTIEDNNTNDGSGIGAYTSIVSNLSPSTTYYIRAYARNSSGVGYGIQQKFTTLSTLQIGDTFQGGLIFYLDSTGLHGLVSATTDQSISVQWGCSNTAITGADESEIGSGQANTDDITNGCHVPNIAASVCADLSLNGYSDWFLPSKEELKLMYNNLHLQQLGTFTNAAYWSSTEMTSVFAWQISFTTGIVQGASKSTPSMVRAVRAF